MIKRTIEALNKKPGRRNAQDIEKLVTMVSDL